MFIIRYSYSHQYKRVIVIVYWSEYPDEVIPLDKTKGVNLLKQTKIIFDYKFQNIYFLFVH